MSFSAAFDDIAEMRRADDPSLDQGAWVTSLKQADWPGVVRHCTELLQTRTKDLRLAMWLTEALAQTEGRRGLVHGLNFCADLCARYWPELYPRPDGGDMDERTGNIAWLLQRITDLAQTLPVTHSSTGERHSLRDLAQARMHDAQAGDHAPSLASSKVLENGAHLTTSRFRRALADTPAAVLRQTLSDQQDTQAALQHWQTVVDAEMGNSGPSFVAAREALAQAAHSIALLLRDVGVEEPSATMPRADHAHAHAHVHSHARAAMSTSATIHPTQSPAMVGKPSNPSGPTTPPEANAPGVLRGPQTRIEALHLMREVAAFFRDTEPHSPVAYLAEKAVKWGEMPLHLWLQEVVKDDGAMAHLNELLGTPSQHHPEQG